MKSSMNLFRMLVGFACMLPIANSYAWPHWLQRKAVQTVTPVVEKTQTAVSKKSKVAKYALTGAGTVLNAAAKVAGNTVVGAAQFAYNNPKLSLALGAGTYAYMKRHDIADWCAQKYEQYKPYIKAAAVAAGTAGLAYATIKGADLLKAYFASEAKNAFGTLTTTAKGAAESLSSAANIAHDVAQFKPKVHLNVAHGQEADIIADWVADFEAINTTTPCTPNIQIPFGVQIAPEINSLVHEYQNPAVSSESVLLSAFNDAYAADIQPDTASGWVDEFESTFKPKIHLPNDGSRWAKEFAKQESQPVEIECTEDFVPLRSSTQTRNESWLERANTIMNHIAPKYAQLAHKQQL